MGKTATIKKIRLKAKFNIETEKVTTVTFDGNGGVTNDSARLESVTESYPINKDFTMKNEDSFVREGYTLVGWAFQRTDGSLVTAEAYKDAVETKTQDELIQLGIYTPGQDVAADNLEVSDVNNWNPLENTVYAIWEPHVFTVTVKKLVDGETATDKEFSFAATGLSDKDDDTAFSLANGGTNTVSNVPYGTTFTLTETPCAGYAVKSVVAKQTSNANNEALSRPVVLEGKDGKTYTVKGDIEITYTNKRAAVPVQIVKIDQEGNALEGATFSISGGDISETGLESKIPKDGTEALIYKNESLPLGTYTLTETDAPDGYIALEGDVTVTVGIEGSDVVVTAKVGDTDIPADRIVRDEETGLWTVKVMNSAGVELPAAGGVGTWPVTLAGIAMMAGAAAWLLLGARRQA